MKYMNTSLEGVFVNRKGKMYKVENKNKSTEDLFNFYLKGEEEEEDILVCSVHTRYHTRAKGAKKAGDITRKVYGDYQVYTDFESLRGRALGKPKKQIEDMQNRKIVDEELEEFVDVVEKRGQNFYHKLTYWDKALVQEDIQMVNDEGSEKETIRMEMVNHGKSVKVKLDKSVEYAVRETDRKEDQVGVLNIQSLDYIAMKKDISWMKERKYRILDNMDEVKEYVEKMEELNTVVGFDTETSGLNINRLPFDHPKRDNLVGICLSIEQEEGVYIPFRQLKFNNVPEQECLDLLQPYLCANGEKAQHLVTHHGSFDWKVMYGYGWDLNIVDDTYLLQYLIDVRQANSVKKLKAMSENLLGLQMVDLEDFFPAVRGGKKADIKFSLLPYESVLHYGPVDSDITRELYFHLKPKLDREMEFIYGVEVKLMRWLSRTEYYGIRVDLELTMKFKKEYEQKRDDLEQQVYEVAGEEFNIGSPNQLEYILFDKLGYPSHGETDSGNRATGKLVLEMLSKDTDKDGNKLYPLAKVLLDYKKADKLLTSFLDKILVDNVDGYLFPKFNQAGTKSGRLSSNNPNLQQTSGAIRNLFIPDNDDYYFLIVDYSQVEYRIMAGLSDEYEVINFFKNNPEADYHTLMYSRMTGKEYKDVTSEERKEGKTLNFGISYGMAPPSLALKLYGSNAKEYSEMAEKKIGEYFESVSNIRDYLTMVKDGAQLRGFVKTLFKRKRTLTEFTKDNPKRYEIEKGKRKAGNTVVQGTAADIMKIAHVNVEEGFKKKGYDARVVGSVHDELVILVNKKYNPWLMIDLVRKAMEIDLSNYNFPPLYIGANVGTTWGDGKEDHLEAPVMLMEEKSKEVEKGMHTEAVEDPREYVANDLVKFAIKQVALELEKEGVRTVEEAWEVPRLASYAGDFLMKNADFVIKGLLSGESQEDIYSNLERVDELPEDFYSIDNLEDAMFDEEDTFEGEEGEEKEYIDFRKVQNYYEENKDLLKVDAPEITKASKTYNESYSVLAYDREIFVKVNEPTEDMLRELVGLFRNMNVEKGYAVTLQVKGKFKTLPYKVTRIPRLEVFDIIEKHLNKGSKAG